MSILRWVTSAALVVAFAASPAFAQSSQKAAERPRDSVLNGALIGAAAGVAGALVFTKMSCGTVSGDSECSMIAGPVGALIMVPAGIVIGALIDRSIGNNRVIVGPAVGKHKAGVAATVRF